MEHVEVVAEVAVVLEDVVEAAEEVVAEVAVVSVEAVVAVVVVLVEVAVAAEEEVEDLVEEHVFNRFIHLSFVLFYLF